MKKLLTTKELANIFGLNETTLQRWVKKGELFPYGENEYGGYLFSREELLINYPLLNRLEKMMMNRDALCKTLDISNYNNKRLMLENTDVISKNIGLKSKIKHIHVYYCVTTILLLIFCIGILFG